MGVLGIVAIAFLFSLYKSILAIPKYFLWKKQSVLAIATIKELKNIEYTYKDFNKTKILSKKYIYETEIQYNGNLNIIDFPEVVSGDGVSNFLSGTSFEVYYNDKEKKFINAKELKNNIWQYPLASLISAVVIVLGLLFLSLIK